MKTLRLTTLTLLLSFPVFSMMEPNDSEVVTTSLAMSSSEITLSKLAQEKAKNKKVKDFADMIVRDHAQSRRDTLALINRTELEEKTTENIQNLEEQTKIQHDRLAKLSGKKFDDAYMELMIENHKAARYKYDQALVPYAKNPELKAMLQQNQRDIEDHLKRAQRVERSL